jgi:hypothetical protein
MPALPNPKRIAAGSNTGVMIQRRRLLIYEGTPLVKLERALDDTKYNVILFYTSESG